MPRPNKPWYRKDRKRWYVTINGVWHNLGPTKKEAMKKFHQLMAEPYAKPTSPDAALTIIDKFLDWTQRNKSEETYKWYKKHCQSFAKYLAEKQLREIPADSLKTHHVQDWIDSHEKWSDGTKHGAWRAINRTFNWAVKQEYTEKNPATNVERPTPPTRERIITPDQFKTIIENVLDDDFKDLLNVSWDTGCRPQESLRVTKANVHAQCWIFKPDEGKKHRGRKKIRFVYLTDRAWEITQRRALKFPEGPIFRNTEGNPWTPFSVDCRFKRLKKHVGEKFCLYDFRHSLDARMREAGVDSFDIAALLGHSDLSMLGRVYSHPHTNPKRLLKILRSAS